MKKERHRLHITSSKHVTAVGILGIFFGFVSLIMSFIVGQWSDPTPRRLKKAA